MISTPERPPLVLYRYVPSVRASGELEPAASLSVYEASFRYYDALYRSPLPFTGLGLGGVPFHDPDCRYAAYPQSFVAPVGRFVNLVCTNADLESRNWEACWADGAINVAVLAAWPPFRTRAQRDLFAEKYPHVLVPHPGVICALQKLGVGLTVRSVCPPEPQTLAAWLHPLLESL